MTDNFDKINKKDGKPKTCKFCHAEVWWNLNNGRWYNTDGKTLHVENCKLSQEHYKKKAAQNAETRRQNKNT